MSQPDLFTAERTCYVHKQTVCGECWDALNAEHVSLRDRYHRLLGEMRDWEKRVYSAARRTATNELHAYADFYAAQQVYDSQTAIRELIHRAQQLPTEAGRTQAQREQIGQLQSAAISADRYLREHKPEGTFTSEAARADVIRLRELLMQTGRKLHAASGRPSGGCDCDGCSLIIAMDLPERMAGAA